MAQLSLSHMSLPLQYLRLQQFLKWSILAAFGFGILAISIGLLLDNMALLIVGVNCCCDGGFYYLARWLLKAGKIQRTMTVISAALVSSGIIVGMAFPVTLPLVILFPVLTVFVAIPYTESKSLNQLMLFAWLAGLIITFLGTFFQPFVPPPREVTQILLVTSIPTTIALIFLLFSHYYKRLNETLGDLRLAHGALEQQNDQLARELAERTRMQQALHESEERYALAARGANDGLWDWDMKSGQIYYSPRWKAILGYQDGELGCTPDEWMLRIHSNDQTRVRAELDAHLEGKTDYFESEHRIHHKDGAYRWVLARGVVVRAKSRVPVRMAGSLTDITKRKQVEEQMMRDALYDSLTGLPNRTLFLEHLRYTINYSQRHKGYRFALLFIDLDRFKTINDSLGHIVGDQFLEAVARRLKSCLRQSDTVARLSGDEFAILLDDVKGLADIEEVAARIQDELTAPTHLNGFEVFTTASMGIVVNEERGGAWQPEDYLRNADAAMYYAKSRGRARFERYDESMHRQALGRLQLEAELRHAIERGELRAHYQPIVSLSEPVIVGFEALIRWQHPIRGLIPPSEFLPLAEETGLIVPIGWWIALEACRQMRQWQTLFPDRRLTISVNVSSKQFAQPDMLRRVAETLVESNLPPQSLKLEITENVIMDDPQKAAPLLAELRALGISLQMDDFGTGYSSLSYLHDFAIDVLKIDRSFVSRMQDDRRSLEIVRTIITLARHLDIEVIAEGIETADQLQQLLGLDCRYGQGFFFSRPVDAHVAERLLAKGF